MIGDLLLDPIPAPGQSPKDVTPDTFSFFISFINRLEGWKTKCKNLHWAAPKRNIHVYLDEFLEILSDYQDSLAEEMQGILGHIAPNKIVGTESDTLNAMEFILEVKNLTLKFYSSIPDSVEYAGVRSECETFIHNIWKYKYLFELCDSTRSY